MRKVPKFDELTRVRLNAKLVGLNNYLIQQSHALERGIIVGFRMKKTWRLFRPDITGWWARYGNCFERGYQQTIARSGLDESPQSGSP